MAGSNFAETIETGILNYAGNYETFPISGTVTANVGNISSIIGGGYSNLFSLGDEGNLYVRVISGTVTANLDPNASVIASQIETGIASYAADLSNDPLPISGTVTANSSNGELTTRFGSISTANTAFATTAVTNTSRKYLMIQNIASTVITAGIGFTPTTTQGIQIVAGATITFDGNYIPTGAVRILSSVTASNFTVLEA